MINSLGPVKPLPEEKRKKKWAFFRRDQKNVEEIQVRPEETFDLPERFPQRVSAITNDSDGTFDPTPCPLNDVSHYSVHGSPQY